MPGLTRIQFVCTDRIDILMEELGRNMVSTSLKSWSTSSDVNRVTFLEAILICKHKRGICRKNRHYSHICNHVLLGGGGGLVCSIYIIERSDSLFVIYTCRGVDWYHIHSPA